MEKCVGNIIAIEYIVETNEKRFQLRSLKARSRGAIFSDCDCVFLSHAMGCVDVNDTVQTVRL